MEAPFSSPERAQDRTRPILKWAGGKSGLLPQLTPLFPKVCRTYFEPFFGGGAVFFALKYAGSAAYLNDSNPELITLYETVRDQPHLLVESLDHLRAQYSEKFYYELRASTPKNKVDRAARTVFLNKTGFNGLYRQNTKGGFNVPFGKRVQCPALYDKKNIQQVSQALQRAVLLSTDFAGVIQMAGPGDFIYCDPPYEPLSRTSSFNTYQGVGFSQKDQKRLKEACLLANQRGAYVAISNSSADFIQELYQDCDVRVVSARRPINANGDRRGKVEEVVVLMRPHGFFEMQPNFRG